MAGLEIPSKLAKTPGIFKLMDVDQPSAESALRADYAARIKDAAGDRTVIDALIKDQQNPARAMFASKYAVSLNYASEFTRTMAIDDNAVRTVAAAQADMHTLTRGDTLSDLPAPYYPITPVSTPTREDVQQALANFAANMVKEANRNPKIASLLAPAVDDIAQLREELMQNKTLTREQLFRLENAENTFIGSVGSARGAEENMQGYINAMHSTLVHGADVSNVLDLNATGPEESFKSKLADTPKILELMHLNKDQISDVLNAQKDETRNPDKLFAADLAIKLGYASPGQKNIALMTQAGQIASAAQEDLTVLKRCSTLSHLPNPYYTSRIATPTAIDAQQAVANFAANMVKEIALNPSLTDILSPAVEDMIKLTAEIRKNPKLTPQQISRLDIAADLCCEHLPLARTDAINLSAYTAELHHQVVDGTANSMKLIEASINGTIGIATRQDPRIEQINTAAAQTENPSMGRLQATLQALGRNLDVDGVMGHDTRIALEGILTSKNIPVEDRALLITAVRGVDPQALEPKNKQVLADADTALGINRANAQPEKRTGANR